jgi:CTP synthase
MILVHVTLVPVDTMGDHKTKPTQHSVKALRELGLQPDIIVGRSREVLSQQTKKKISAFTDVPAKAVISAKDVPDIYQIPMELEKEGLADVVCSYLGLENRQPDPAWYRVVSMEYTNRVTVAIVSKYGIEDVYMSIKEALKHAGRALSTEVNIRWLDAEAFDPRSLADIDGILVPGGFGKRGIEGKIQAIRYARENKKPYLGLCLGFQLAVIEYARHVAGIEDATSEEIDEGTHVIALLPEQEGISELGGTMRLGNCNVTLKEGTMVAGLYGETSIVERHRHRYEVNPTFIADLEAAGLVFSGFCGQRMEVCEIPGHPFYLATQFHPEFRSSPTRPSPPYVGFVEACKKNKSTQNQVAEQNDER